MAHRQADQHNDVQPLAGLKDGGKGLLCTAQQGVLQKEVTAGVAGQRKLRQAEQLDVFGRVFAHNADNLLGIIGAVCHTQGRACRSGTDKTIFKSGKAVLHSQTSFITVYKIIIAQRAPGRKCCF